jgi:hypothetical protein
METIWPVAYSKLTLYLMFIHVLNYLLNLWLDFEDFELKNSIVKFINLRFFSKSSI